MQISSTIPICVFLSIIACQLMVVGAKKPANSKGWPKDKKDKAEERQKEAKDKFKEMKKAGQVDRAMGKSTLRADKNGGNVIIQRKGEYFAMKVKEIVAKHANETEISKTSLKDIKFNVTKDRNDTATYGVTAAFIEMAAALPNGANISVQLFMFKDAGNVTGEDGNIYELVEGGTKTNIKIDGWPNQVGYLDVVIAVKCGFKGEKGKKPKKSSAPRGRKGMGKALGRRNPETFAVCSNAQMTFSPSFNSSGKDVDMPAGFPKSRELSSDGESEIELRFNGTNIFYDPTIETGDDIGDDVGDADSSAMSLKNVSTSVLIACLFSVLKQIF